MLTANPIHCVARLHGGKVSEWLTCCEFKSHEEWSRV